MYCVLILMQMDIAASKNLIPATEQKAAKLTVCQFSACCCLAPGNQNGDAFAETNSPWHASVSESSQPPSFPSVLPYPPAGSCSGGMLGTMSQWHRSSCAYPRACSETELRFAFQAMCACGYSTYSNCSGDQHLPHATERSLKSKESPVSHPVFMCIEGRYRVRPLCLVGIEGQVEKVLLRDECCQALSLLLISLQRQVIESQQSSCTAVIFIFCLSLSIPYQVYTYLHFGQERIASKVISRERLYCFFPQ